MNFYQVDATTAITKTVQEANAILQELLDYSENVGNNEKPDLDELFEPLHKEEAYNHKRFHTDFKAKGFDAPWVRIYAVKIDDNLFIITGYGIKLTQQMQDDSILLEELNKLERATNFLIQEGYI